MPTHLLTLALAMTILLCSCGSTQKDATPWPGTTAWVPVTQDPTITISVNTRTTGSGNERTEYDVATATLTLRAFFGAAIAWKDGDFIMLVLWDPLANGASLVRIRPATKEIVYAAALIGIGGVDHSQYHNRISVFTNRDLLMVVGDEGAGHYSEIRRSADGSLVTVSQEYNTAFPQLAPLLIK